MAMDSRTTPAEDIVHQCRGLALSDANEAETRIRIIDRVMFEVLGWTRDDCRVEEYVEESNTFADYIFRTASGAFVLEAKRIGASHLPVGNDRRVRLTKSFMAGDLGRAISQARKYALEKSIPFAIVTNGDQWIIFPGARTDQVSFAESTALVFPSIEAALIRESEDFISLLSRDAVIGGSLELALLGRASSRIEDRRLGFYFSNRGRAPRENPLFPLLRDGIDLAFGEVFSADDPETLEKCYVRTPDRRRYDSQLKMQISQSRLGLGRALISPMHRKGGNKVPSILTGAKVARPLALLVLGRVGAGKTTFLKYLRYVACADYFQREPAKGGGRWIELDFRAFSPDASAREFILGRVNHYLDADQILGDFDLCLRHVYENEIASLRRGPLKLLSPEKADEKISEFLLQRFGSQEDVEKRLRFAARISPVFIAIDNVDQIESEDTQAGIFSSAIALAQSCGLNIAIALRESTFVAHRSSAVIDAFDYTPVSVEPPQVPAVLSKRFSLAREILHGRSGYFVAENGARVEVEDCGRLVELIAGSVLGTNVGEVIDVLSQSDVRLALRLTREFLASGYSDPGRAWTTYKSRGRYVMPRHEALRAVILGNSDSYREASSPLGNVFDSRLERGDLQFVRLFLLNSMVKMAERPDFNYIDGPTIRSMLNRIGVDDNAILSTLRDLAKFRFVYTAGHGEPSLTSSYYPSRLGGYLRRKMLFDLTFLEAMMMDTFIASVEVWDRLKALSEEIDSKGSILTRMELRCERARLFFNYVRDGFDHLVEQARARALPSDWVENPMKEMEQTLERSLLKAEASARRNYPAGK